MRHRFLTADVFTDRIFGGNPLAVFPDARALPAARMQRVAREINYSETVFVLPPDDPAHTRRLRIFTPAAEIPFAGHPTVGTAFALAAVGEVPFDGIETRVIFEMGVGNVPVEILGDGNGPTEATLTVARLPERGPDPPAPADLARILGLSASDLAGEPFAPETLSAGVPYLFVPLRDRAALGRARVDAALWQERLSGFWAPNLYLLTPDPELAGSQWRTRMFAPGLGVPEDPATGSAAVTLATYLGSREPAPDGAFTWVVEQGFEMGRPSLLRVAAEKRAGVVTAIRVGGGCVLVAEGTMEVPD